MRADQIAWSEGTTSGARTDRRRRRGRLRRCPQRVRADEGMIEAGAAGVHWEDQLASEKKCGHLGGKVLVPDRAVHPDADRRSAGRRCARRPLPSWWRAPTRWRPRCSPPTSTSATRVHDRRAHARRLLPVERDRRRDRARAGLRAVRRHALVRDRPPPTWMRLGCSPTAIHAVSPGKLLAYNCSPVVQLEAAPGRRRDRRASRRNWAPWATSSSSSRSPGSTR